MSDIFYPTTGNTLKKLRDMGDGSVAEVVSAPAIAPRVWPAGTVFDGTTFGDIEIQVIGTPTTGYILQDSFNGTNWNDCTMLDRNGAAVAAITAPGRYRVPGTCFLQTRQGAGSTIYIRAGN